MPTITDGELILVATAATEAELRRAFTAAHASLADAGVDLDAAYAAIGKPEQIDADGEGEMTAEDDRLYDAWRAAEAAAREALPALRPHEVKLHPFQSWTETRVYLNKTLEANPRATVVPPIDPGPHYVFERANV